MKKKGKLVGGSEGWVILDVREVDIDCSWFVICKEKTIMHLDIQICCLYYAGASISHKVSQSRNAFTPIAQRVRFDTQTFK
jgi:hypothetical protein